MLWTDIPIHFIDFEGGSESGVVEYGIVTLQQGRVKAVQTQLCRPVGRLKEEDVAVHRLHGEELERCSCFSCEFERFAGLRETGPFAAHFAGTENALIKAVWPYGRTVPDFSRPGGVTAEWGPWIDTGRLVSGMGLGAASLQLEALVSKFELQDSVDQLAREHCPPARCFYHAALYDALAGASLLMHLLNPASVGVPTLLWLLQQSAGKAEKVAKLQQDNLF